MQPNREKVVLTGFMGTGKTTVGRLLATLLDYDFVDTDELIESRHGPISEIFKNSGQDKFRELEAAIAAELADTTGAVIATGGRMMLDRENAANLAAGAHVYCLVAKPEDIAERVAGSDRPLLAEHDDPAARIEQLLNERHAGYSEFRAIDTSGRTPIEVAADIVRQVREAHDHRSPVGPSSTAPEKQGRRAVLAAWRRYRARGRRYRARGPR